MLYAVTIIRLNFQTLNFENTVVNNILLKQQIEDHLNRLNCPVEEFEKFYLMKVGSITIEIKSIEKIWFVYIHKVT
jgi:hypothetical protein